MGLAKKFLFPHCIKKTSSWIMCKIKNYYFFHHYFVSLILFHHLIFEFCDCKLILQTDFLIISLFNENLIVTFSLKWRIYLFKLMARFDLILYYNCTIWSDESNSILHLACFQMNYLLIVCLFFLDNKF